MVDHSSAVDSLNATKQGRGWRFYALCIAGVLLAILVLQNLQQVEVRFLVINAQIPLIFALAIAGGLGSLVGWAFPHVRRSRQADKAVHLEPDD